MIHAFLYARTTRLVRIVPNFCENAAGSGSSLHIVPIVIMGKVDLEILTDLHVLSPPPPAYERVMFGMSYIFMHVYSLSSAFVSLSVSDYC
jgi:hypothetical protein